MKPTSKTILYVHRMNHAVFDPELDHPLFRMYAQLCIRHLKEGNGEGDPALITREELQTFFPAIKGQPSPVVTLLRGLTERGLIRTDGALWGEGTHPETPLSVYVNPVPLGWGWGS